MSQFFFSHCAHPRRRFPMKPRDSFRFGIHSCLFRNASTPTMTSCDWSLYYPRHEAVAFTVPVRYSSRLLPDIPIWTWASMSFGLQC